MQTAQCIDPFQKADCPMHGHIHKADCPKYRCSQWQTAQSTDTFREQTAQNIAQEADCLVPMVTVCCRSRKPTAVAPYVLEGFLRILDVSVLEMGEPLDDMRH